MAQGNVATPFLDMRSFVREESEVSELETAKPALGSPFVSVYELEGMPEFFSPEEEAYATLAQELYDQEFDEALFELMVAARGLHEEHFVANAQSVDGERALTQHFNQLIREAEAAVGSFEREFGARDVGALREGELEAFAESYAPATPVSPEFEEFLGKLVKKVAKGVKSVAKKAGKLAVKLGLGPILNKIKALVKPLLDKVLQTAIGRLPAAVRPAAQQLADRLTGRKTQPADASSTASTQATAADAAADAAPEDAATAVQEPADAGATELQQEFDQQLANLFVAADEVDMELEVARVRNDARVSAPPVFADLDQARERFIDQLHELREGEDPGPVVQNFLPAVLPALRLGVKLAGRARVVNFLSGFLSKMIAKLVDPATAPALSKAIVDAGLKLLTLEVTAQDEARAGVSAIAATVEETVRRVSNLPDYVLDNQELLEGFALEAFEQAAAANLPPVLSEAVYRERPDLLESRGARAAWVMLPLRRRKRYKKCGRTFKVRISPYMADEVESFEGPLADYLQDQLGVEDATEVEAELELFETLPGATLADIARSEAEAAGATGTPGTPAQGAAQLHPLTPKAAGLLLGEPRLGRHMPWRTHRRRIGVGQRFYRLSIPGRRMLTWPAPNGKAYVRRPGGLRVWLDVSKNEVRISVFLSEVKAQRLAVRLRRASHAGTIAASFQKYIERRLGPIVRGDRVNGQVQIIQAGLAASGDTLGAALRRLPADATAAFAARIQESLVSAFAEFAKSQAQRFIAAAEDTADGVTLTFTIAQPPGLEQLGKALLPNGQASGLADAIRAGAAPQARVDVAPGYARG